jgi:hypothetical protein
LIAVNVASNEEATQGIYDGCQLISATWIWTDLVAPASLYGKLRRPFNADLLKLICQIT